MKYNRRAQNCEGSKIGQIWMALFREGLIIPILRLEAFTLVGCRSINVTVGMTGRTSSVPNSAHRLIVHYTLGGPPLTDRLAVKLLDNRLYMSPIAHMKALKKSTFLKSMLLLNFLIRWSKYILNLSNISMRLNKCIIQWFWVDVTSKARFGLAY